MMKSSSISSSTYCLLVLWLLVLILAGELAIKAPHETLSTAAFTLVLVVVSVGQLVIIILAGHFSIEV